MSYLSIFRTNENQKQKWDSIIYEISEFVSAFFWDEAPDKCKRKIAEYLSPCGKIGVKRQGAERS